MMLNQTTHDDLRLDRLPDATTEARRLPSPERTSTVTPLDLRKAKFGTQLRGFDKNEVTTFVQEAAEGFEQALRENERLRQELARLEASLNQYRELEGSLKSTLVSAQKVADDMRENAQQEASRIVREAEGKAELITLRAQSRLEDVQREIDGLRVKRGEAEMHLESIISALHSTLDFIRDQDRRERQEKVVAHPSTSLGAGRPRLEVASA